MSDLGLEGARRGIGYLAFVADVFSRAIAGWAAATSQRPKLVLDAFEMALWRRDTRPVSASWMRAALQLVDEAERLSPLSLVPQRMRRTSCIVRARRER